MGRVYAVVFTVCVMVFLGGYSAHAETASLDNIYQTSMTKKQSTIRACQYYANQKNQFIDSNGIRGELCLSVL